jgi:hypothetical protein
MSSALHSRTVLGFLASAQIRSSLDREFSEILAKTMQPDLCILKTPALIRRLNQIIRARRALLAPTVPTDQYTATALKALYRHLAAKAALLGLDADPRDRGSWTALGDLGD